MGQRLDFLANGSVRPGAEADWRLVQIAPIDICARKKAEVCLEYLGKHDVLTRLRRQDRRSTQPGPLA